MRNEGGWREVNPATRTRWTVLFLALLPGIFFWRHTLGWEALGDQDAVFWFFPAYRFVAEQLRTGHLPLWSPYFYSGAPLFGQWQAGALDPINWIYLLGTTSRLLTLAQEAAFAVSLVSTFLYARAVGLGRRAGVVAAVIYGLSGFAVARTLYPGFIHITALCPLALFFIERLYRRGRKADLIAGAAVIGWQVLAAHPQPLIYSSLLACGYAIFSLLFRDEAAPDYRGVKGAALFLGHFSAIFVAGAGLAAIQLIPAAEVATLSVRQDWPFEMFTLHSLHPASLLTVLFPFLHGGGSGIFRLPYWGNYWHHNEAQIYLGVAAIGLAMAGAAAAVRARYLPGIFWACAGVFGAVLSLGKYSGPVARLLYHVPLLSHFRSPNRHWMEVSLATAVLAGYCVDRILRSEPDRAAGQARMAAAGLAVLCLIVGGSVLWDSALAEKIVRSLPDYQSLPQGFLHGAGTEFAVPMLIALAGTAVVSAFAARGHGKKLYPLLLLFLLADYNLYEVFAPVGNGQKLEDLIGTAVPESLARNQDRTSPFRYHVYLDPRTGEFQPFWFYRHEMASGYDPMLSGRYKTFSGIDEAGRTYSETMLDPADRTLDLLGVRYVFFPPGREPSERARFRRLPDRSQAELYRDFSIYENLNAMPRAWMVGRAAVEYEGDQLKLIRGQTASNGHSGFDPAQTALVDHQTAGSLDSSLLEATDTRPAAGSARIVQRSHTAMLVETQSTAPSILVLGEPFAPGWKAEIDGVAGRLLRVDYDLRGVALGEGTHRVRIFYDPLTVRIGAAISALTAIILLLCGIPGPGLSLPRRSKRG